MSGRVAISGANGFIGRHLCAHFTGRGWDVRALVRNPESVRFADERIEVFRCDLPDRVDEEALADVDAVVHCAYSTRPESPAEASAVNEQGTERLHALSRAAAVDRFVFLSSTAAHEGALSHYGRSKLELEQRLDLDRDSVVRAGLVIGSGNGGLFPRMVEWLRGAKLAPVIDGGHQILQTVYVEDLCGGIERVIVSGDSGRRVLAETEGLPIRAFFRLVADRLEIRCRLVPVPGTPAVIGLRLAERLRIPLPISSENVLGLRSLRHQDSAADLAALGIEARPARQSLRLVLGPAQE